MKNTKCIFLPVIHFTLTYLEKRCFIYCFEKKNLKTMSVAKIFLLEYFVLQIAFKNRYNTH